MRMSRAQPLSLACWAAVLAMAACSTGRAGTVTLFTDDFEGAFPGTDWDVVDNASPDAGTWDVTTNRFSGGTQSVYCCETLEPAPGPYNHDMFAWMIYGPFDLTGVTGGGVTFDTWVDSESSYDGLCLGFFTSHPSDFGYDDGEFTWWVSGDTKGWGSIDLTFEEEGVLDQPQVWFALMFMSDVNHFPPTSYEGAYVDNVLIEAESAVPDDCYEENDTWNKSWDFTGGENQLLSDYGAGDPYFYPRPQGVQLDEDWYETTVAIGYERLIVECTFTHANGNIDIEIREQTGDLIGESISTTDNEYIDVVVPSFGSYYIRVYGDDGGNTYDLKWYTIGTQPDLVVTNIQPSSTNPPGASTISVTVTVKNQGDADAAGFTVALFYDLASPPILTTSDDASDTLSSLGAGASTTVTFTGITGPASGTWQMYAYVDHSTSIVDESDEGNNAGGPVTVTWSDLEPDLTVDDITITGAPTVGQNITVHVDISNLSADAEAVDFRVDLFYDRAAAPSVGETGDQQQTVASLAALSSTQVDFTVTSPVPATWTMWAIVDTIQAVNEDDETNNVSTAGTDITWEGVDLEVTAVAPSASAALIGTSIDVDVTVRNNGNLIVAIDAFAVGLVHDSAAAPTIPVASDETPLRNLTGIAADGGTEMLSFTGVTSATVGTWQMWVAADNAGEVGEYDETNNVLAAASVVTWCAPDLRIVSVTPSPSNPTTSQTIDVEVEVENQGDWDAAEFVVGLIYHSATVPSPGAVANETWTVTGGLAVGAQATYTFTGIAYIAPSEWSMYAIADNVASPGAVQESDETNNVSAGTTVIWGTAKPDLVITNVIYAPAGDPSITDEIAVTVTVENIGDVAAGQFEVGLYLDESVAPVAGSGADRTVVVTSLDLSKPLDVEFTAITSAVPGTWQMYAVADDGLVLNEKDEDNNVSDPATQVNWRAPELVVSTISVTPTQDPDVGTTVTAMVTVTNNGDAPAENFSVVLFYDLDTPPAVGALADDTDTVNSLAGSGTSTTVSFTGITSFESGAWDMYAIVDNGEAVAESDETNNVFGPATVNWHGPDLVVVSITPSDTSPLTTDTISVDVTVRNTGDRLASSCEVALFYNRSSAPSVGDKDDEVLATGVLAANGGEQTLTFDNGGSGINSSIEEVWQMWAVVDNGSAVAEGSESNNVGGPVTVTWGTPLVPDLVVLSVTPLPNNSPPIPGTISVEVVVANNGTADAAFFNVGLYFDRDTAPGSGSTPDRTSQIPLLAAGTDNSADPVVFTGISNDVPEVWKMYVFVDSGETVSETSEGNNTFGPVQVNWGGLAGIIVTAPDGGEVWEAGTTHQITWDSYGDIGSLDVDIEYSTDNGVIWSPIVASTLDDGVYDWTVPDADSALCLVRITAAEGASPPSDVSDATFSIVPTVGEKADLRIVSLSPSLSYAMPGTPVTIDVAVRNFGTARADNFFLTLYYDRSTPPAATDPGNRSVLIGTLASGSEVTVSFADITSAEYATWHMYAYVDPGTGGGSVEESNETNNAFGPVMLGWGEDVGVVRVVAPNGGESFERGSTCTIEWDEPKADVGTEFNIEISTDGGATWTEVARDVPDDDHTYQWRVDAEPSTACRMRISNSAGTVSDVSDRVFSVVAEGTGAPMLIGEGCAPVRKTHHAPARWAWALLLALALVKRKRALAG